MLDKLDFLPSDLEMIEQTMRAVSSLLWLLYSSVAVNKCVTFLRTSILEYTMRKQVGLNKYVT